jgi:phospholipid transport system substrate-binding protein
MKFAAWCLLSTFLILLPNSLRADEKKFTGEAAKLKDRMEDLFQASKGVNGPEKSAARAKIENALDWERIAKGCLGPAEWKKQAGKNRAEFEKLLHEVVVLTAYSRMDKFWEGDTKYRIEKIDVDGNDATVRSKFTVNGDSFLLEYFLDRQSGTWKVYDISFEDQRYSVNINEQLNAFLKEKSFAQLLQSLRKRRDELKAGGGTKPAKKES